MSDFEAGIPKQLLEFLSELTDGRMSPERTEELRQLLADDPQALEWYCEWMTLHADLHLNLSAEELTVADWRATEPREPRVALSPNVAASNKLRRIGPWAAALAAGGLAAAWAFVAMIDRPPAPGPQANDNPVAAVPAVLAPNAPVESIRTEIVFNDDGARAQFLRTDNSTIAIVSSVAAASTSSSTRLSPGANLSPGRFVLDSGAVQLEFLSGANLVIEGPADIELLSNNSVYCRLGKLRARVPKQAQGFTIETPTHRAVDLGTEFAVGVGPEFGEEIHVLDGEVKLLDKSRVNDELLLELGDAFKVRADGRGAPIRANGARFIGAEQMLELSASDSRSRYGAWKNASFTLATDPDAVTYFNFEDHSPWQRELRQDSENREAPAGAIVGCQWTDGRWPGKQALEFKGTEDRVRIDVPGEFTSASLACWVRINGFDRFLSSLLLTQGHDVGEIHWQFTETGRLMLGVKADWEWSQDYISGVVLKPSDVGRWMHLACVYDRQSGRVSHYLDGQRVSTEAIRKHVTLRIGAAELGNWTPEVYRDHRIRALNGRIDEFVVLKRALSDEEIAAMYGAGQPN